MLDLADVKAIEKAALLELETELWRAQVDAAKERIRARSGRPWWKTILPRITITWSR